MRRLAFALALLVTSAAQAEPAVVGGDRLELPLPAGHCALDPARPDESAHLEFLRQMQPAKDVVLIGMMPCDELEAWRGGAEVDGTRYGVWIALNAAPSAPPFPVSTASRVRMVEELYGALGGDAMEFARRTAAERAAEVAARWRVELDADLKSSGVRVVGADDDGLHLALYVAVQPDSGLPDGAGVSTITLVGGHVLALNLYEPHQGPETWESLSALTRAALRRAFEING